MTEAEAIQAVFTSASILDTLLNVGTFAFIGVLIWLYTKAPFRGQDR